MTILTHYAALVVGAIVGFAWAAILAANSERDIERDCRDQVESRRR